MNESETLIESSVQVPSTRNIGPVDCYIFPQENAFRWKKCCKKFKKGKACKSCPNK